MIILVINLLVIIIFIACLYLLRRFEGSILTLFCTSSEHPEKCPLEDEKKEIDDHSIATSEVESFSSSLDLDISIDEHIPILGDRKASSIKHRVRDSDMHHQPVNNHHATPSATLSAANHNSFPYYSYRLVNSSNQQISPRRNKKHLKKENSIDLVSMAERGKICKNESVDGTSLSSESATPDTEEEMKPFLDKKSHKNFARLSTVRETARLNGTNNRFKNRQLNRFYSEEKADNRIAARRLKLSNSLDRDNIMAISNDVYDSTRMLLDSHSNINGASDSDSIIMPKEIMTEDGPVGRYGALQVTHAYDPPTGKLYVSILKAFTVPTIKDRVLVGINHNNQVFVKVVLLPNCAQKFRTRGRTLKNGVAEFKECFTFNRILPEEVHNQGLRYRLFVLEKLKREHCLGEYILPFSTHKPFQQEVKLWLNMEAIISSMNKSDSKSDVSSLARSDSTGSNHSMQKDCSPELLLGLSYNGTTGRLQVFVIRGSQFRSPKTNRPPDTYVKLSLVSFSGQEISRSKTLIQKSQLNPHFKESFIFPITLFQLHDVTLIVSVYNKRTIKRRELIGWFSLGRNNTGEEEKAHWTDMKENRREQICRWHVLLDS